MLYKLSILKKELIEINYIIKMLLTSPISFIQIRKNTYLCIDFDLIEINLKNTTICIKKLNPLR